MRQVGRDSRVEHSERRRSGNEKFHSAPSITTDSNRLSYPKHVTKLLAEHRVNKSAAAKKEPPGSLIPAGVAAESLLVKFGRSGVDM
jgi:hypothetical protein